MAEDPDLLARSLRERARALIEQAEAIEARACTGLAASWCPRCGDCSCPDREQTLDDRGCPLHAPGSDHAATAARTHRGAT